MATTVEENAPVTWPPRIVVCVGTVALRDGKALFIRQAKGQSLAGQWSIPWGVVELGETPDDAMLRETLEEGGVTAVLAFTRKTRGDEHFCTFNLSDQPQSIDTPTIYRIDLSNKEVYFSKTKWLEPFADHWCEKS